MGRVNKQGVSGENKGGGEMDGWKCIIVKRCPTSRLYRSQHICTHQVLIKGGKPQSLRICLSPCGNHYGILPSFHRINPHQRHQKQHTCTHLIYWQSPYTMLQMKENGGSKRKRRSPPLPKILLCAAHWCDAALPGSHLKCKKWPLDRRTACLITVIPNQVC